MHRRALLSAIATLPVAPDLLTRTTAPPLPVEETDAWWWMYVQRAIALGDPKFCTERYLDTAVMRSNLNHTTDQEAMRVLRSAFDGAYGESDVPSPYQG